MLARSRSTLIRLLLMAVLLASTLVAAPVLADTAAPTLPAGWASLSTPQRIEAAYRSGEIDAETRLLYLTYAVYEPASVPTRYTGTLGWFGTTTVREIQAAYRSTDRMRSVSRIVRNEMDRLLGPDAMAAATFCDKEDLDSTDTSTFFTINFASSGGDAIGGGLTLADYKTSLDAAYNVLITNYGWAQVPICGAGGVVCDAGATVTPNGKYPVQVSNLGGTLYGYVGGGGSYGGKNIGDNPHTAGVTEVASSTSCMVLNSDFSQLAGASAQVNLDATTSHEYVHAIQNAWGDPDAQRTAMWDESTAAYFEDEMNDAGNTNLQYLYGDLNNNSLNEWSEVDNHQYNNFLFFRYIAEQFGGANNGASTAGHKVIKKFFENVAVKAQGEDQELLAFKAAVESFIGGGRSANAVANFKDVFHNYAIAVKFLKNCGGSYTAAYCWEEGSQYRAKTDSVFSEDGPVSSTKEPKVFETLALNGNSTGTVKSDYGIKYVRLPNQSAGNYKIELSSSSTTALRASVVCDTDSAFVINAFSQIVTGSTARGFGTYNPTGCQDVVLVITNQFETVGVPRGGGGARALSADHNFNVQLGAANNPAGPTSVTIASFASANGQLAWETGDESGLSGFHIWRGSATAADTRLTDTLVGASGGLTGNAYTWQDPTGPTWGGRAYYWLEAVNTDDSSSFTGPVEVIGTGKLYLPSLVR